MFQAPQPKLKTYSRKGNVADPPAEPSSSSASASIPTLDFVPPSHPSLVGFRGLVLHHQYLRRRAQVNHDQAFRRQYDEVLNEGIFHPSIMITASENMYRSGGFHGDASNENKGDKKADELLYQRFKSVFFWPALMSGTR